MDIAMDILSVAVGIFIGFFICALLVAGKDN